MNRGQPKSLSFPTNSARSKLAKGSSRVRRPELIRFFPEGFDHSSPDLENYCLLESGTKRTQGLAWRNWARLVTTEEKWLLRPKRGCRITDVPYQHSRLLTMNNLDVAPIINKKILYIILHRYSLYAPLIQSNTARVTNLSSIFSKCVRHLMESRVRP